MEEGIKNCQSNKSQLLSFIDQCKETLHDQFKEIQDLLEER